MSGVIPGRNGAIVPLPSPYTEIVCVFVAKLVIELIGSRLQAPYFRGGKLLVAFKDSRLVFESAV